MIRTIAYDLEKRLYDIRYHTDLVRLLFAGCTGKERDVLTLIDSRSLGIEADARRQVAESMRLSSEKNDAATLVMLLGDQVYDDGVPVGTEHLSKALAMLEEDVFQPYQSIKADFFLGVGNHEASAHGKKQKSHQHLDQKTQAYVSAVQQANKPNFHMPANYYALIIRNQQDAVLACIIFADTNSLCYDAEQQSWLMAIVNEFKDLGPDVPWIWAGHHSFLDSVDSRGLKGDGGKYGAPKELHNANQHQLIYATLKKLGFPISRINSVFAAHVHTNYAKINVGSNNLPMTELVFGGGGSWSNTTKQSTLAQGIVWSARTFGHGEVLLNPDGNMVASFKDCSKVKIASPAATQIETSFEIKINVRLKTVSTIENTGLDSALLKKFKKHFSLLNQASYASSSYCFLRLVCHLWQHSYQELEQLSADLNERQVAENPVATLLLLPIAFEHAKVSDQDFLQAIEQCLWLLSTSINHPENQDLRFLGIKAYKKLFTTLQVYHYCIKEILLKPFEQESLDEGERKTNESQRETIDLSLERFKHENRSFLHDDSDDDSDNDESEEAGNAQVASPVEVSVFCKKSLEGGKLQGNPNLSLMLESFLQSFVRDSALLRTMITTAAKQRLDYLYTQYNQKNRKGLSDRDLFYFMGREDAEVARAYVVDFFLNRLPPEVLIQVVMATETNYTADLSGMIFQHLANAFVYKLQRNIDQETENAPYAEAIFKCWRSEHEDAIDELEENDCLRQRACDFLGDYFNSLSLEPSDRVYVDLFNNKPCLEAIWAEDKIFGPSFQAHFNIDQDKTAAYQVWQAEATPTFLQSMWTSLFGKSAVPRVSASATNPMHP